MYVFPLISPAGVAGGGGRAFGGGGGGGEGGGGGGGTAKHVPLLLSQRPEVQSVSL